MAKIHVSSVVPAPIEHVWEYVRDFNDLPKWFPGVTDIYHRAGSGGKSAGLCS